MAMQPFSYEYTEASTRGFAEVSNRTTGQIRQCTDAECQENFLTDLSRSGLELVGGNDSLDIGEIHEGEFQSGKTPQTFAAIFKRIKEFFERKLYKFSDEDLRHMLYGLHQNNFGVEHINEYGVLTHQAVQITKYSGKPRLYFHFEKQVFVCVLDAGVTGITFGNNLFGQKIEFAAKEENSENPQCVIRVYATITAEKNSPNASISSCIMEIDRDFLVGCSIKLSEEEQGIIFSQVNNPKFYLIMPLLLAVFNGNLPALFYLAKNNFFGSLEKKTMQRFFDICIDKFVTASQGDLSKFSVRLDEPFWSLMENLLKDYSSIYEGIIDACKIYHDQNAIKDTLKILCALQAHISISPGQSISVELAKKPGVQCRKIQETLKAKSDELQQQLNKLYSSIGDAYRLYKNRMGIERTFALSLDSAWSNLWVYVKNIPLPEKEMAINFFQAMYKILNNSNAKNPQDVTLWVKQLSFVVSSKLSKDFTSLYNSFFGIFLLTHLPVKANLADSIRKYSSNVCLDDERQTIMNFLNAYIDECTGTHNHHHLSKVKSMRMHFCDGLCEEKCLCDMIGYIIRKIADDGADVQQSGTLYQMIQVLQYYDAYYFLSFLRPKTNASSPSLHLQPSPAITPPLGTPPLDTTTPDVEKQQKNGSPELTATPSPPPRQFTPSNKMP